MDYAAEAQIARELMKFAQQRPLYRGSKPVMWSVVEKTALAEAEVEYEDYVSDQVWVKFPVQKYRVPANFILDMRFSGTPEGDRLLRAESDRLLDRATAWCRDRHLDDHALDDSRQPRDQLLAQDRLWPL